MFGQYMPNMNLVQKSLLFLFGLLPASFQPVLVKTFFGQYPSVWWEQVHDQNAPEWEILPQSANIGEVILSKRNELGVLSNFAPTPFEYRGVRYASVEGFWQMLKFPEGPQDERSQGKVTWSNTREKIAQMSSYEAKTAGDEGSANMKALGISWVTFEGKKINYHENTRGEFYLLIREVMKEKLKQNASVRDMLLKTKGLKLLPDHHQGPNPPPAWRYFEIWMELRDELISSQDSVPKSS